MNAGERLYYIQGTALAHHIQKRGVMTNFIFTPFVVVFFIIAVVVMAFFLASHKIIIVVVKTLNFFSWAAGYEYRLSLDIDKDEK